MSLLTFSSLHTTTSPVHLPTTLLDKHLSQHAQFTGEAFITGAHTGARRHKGPNVSWPFGANEPLFPHLPSVTLSSKKKKKKKKTVVEHTSRVEVVGRNISTIRHISLNLSTSRDRSPTPRPPTPSPIHRTLCITSCSTFFALSRVSAGVLVPGRRSHLFFFFGLWFPGRLVLSYPFVCFSRCCALLPASPRARAPSTSARTRHSGVDPRILDNPIRAISPIFRPRRPFPQPSLPLLPTHRRSTVRGSIGGKATNRAQGATQPCATFPASSPGS